METKKTKTLRLEPNLIKKLEDLAEQENRNFNNLVETILMREAQKQQVNRL